MSMMIAGIISFFRYRLVDGEIGHHAAADKMVPQEAPGELNASLGLKLMGQSQIDLPG